MISAYKKQTFNDDEYGSILANIWHISDKYVQPKYNINIMYIAVNTGKKRHRCSY